MKNPNLEDSYGSCTSVIPINSRDLVALTVYTNENRSEHISNLLLFRDYPNNEPSYLLSAGAWVLDVVWLEKEAFLASDADGRIIQIAGSGDAVSENDDLSPDKLVKTMDGLSVISVGSDGNISLRYNGLWKNIESATSQDLHCAGGLDQDNFWVCGNNGYLARYSGGIWTVVETGTNLSLFTLTCTADGSVYVGGESGIVLVSQDGENFEQYSSEDCDIYGSCIYQSDIIFSSPDYGLLKFDKDGLKEFQKGPKGYEINSNGKLLGVAEDDAILVYNGESWSSVSIF